MFRARFYLPNPEAGEKVELLLRRHSLMSLGSSLVYLLLLGVPFVLTWFMQTQFPELWQQSFAEPLVALATSVYVLSVLLFWYANFLDYWLDVWVVTTERIISVEQKGLFARNFSEQRLYRVQDVSSSVKGFLPTMLHYGDIVAQSAGAEQTTILRQVPRADVVARRILELAEASRRRQGTRE